MSLTNKSLAYFSVYIYQQSLSIFIYWQTSACGSAYIRMGLSIWRPLLHNQYNFAIWLLWRNQNILPKV